MNRSLIPLCLLLIAFTGSTGFADWTTPDLRGVWRVVSTSEDGKPDVLEGESLLLLGEDHFAIIEGDNEYGLPPCAHGWALSDGRGDGTKFQVLLHTPGVTVQRDGTKKEGVSKELVTLVMEYANGGPRQLTVKMPEVSMHLKAERINRPDARMKIRMHLENADFDCPIYLRKVLKEYIALSDQSKPDEQ